MGRAEVEPGAIRCRSVAPDDGALKRSGDDGERMHYSADGYGQMNCVIGLIVSIFTVYCFAAYDLSIRRLYPSAAQNMQ